MSADLYFHAPSGAHVRDGMAFTLKQLLPVEIPAVMGPGEEEGTEVEMEPARTEQHLVDVQYPANWLSLASPEDKAALGLQEVETVGTREDDRYFWVSEQLVGAVRTIVNTPKDAAMVAAMRKAEVDAKLLPVRQVREQTINRLNGIADRLTRQGNTTIRALADDVVQALLDMTKNLPTDPAEVDVELVQRYAVIAAPLVATGSPLVSAFAELDQ